MADDILLYKKNYGNDNIYYKEKIKKLLIDNEDFIKALNNPDLDPESPDDYLNINIFPFYTLLPQTQTDVQNYVCFETSFTNVSKYNRIIKEGQIVFYVLCDVKSIYDKKTGIARHDLIAAIIQDIFCWNTQFGAELKLVSDRPYATDNNYVMRTLTFEQEATNSISDAKTQRIVDDYSR